MGQPVPRPATAVAHASAMGLAARVGFVLLPLTALAVVAALLARFDPSYLDLERSRR